VGTPTYIGDPDKEHTHHRHIVYSSVCMVTRLQEVTEKSQFNCQQGQKISLFSKSSRQNRKPSWPPIRQAQWFLSLGQSAGVWHGKTTSIQC